MQVVGEPVAFFTAIVDSRESPAQGNASRRVLYLLMQKMRKIRPNL
jgi:hypothetical protein